MEFLIIGTLAVVFFGIVVLIDKVLGKQEETSDVEPKRARNDKGHFIADNPDTPKVNEAWEGGKAPKTKSKKKTTGKKKAVKRSSTAAK